MTEGRNKAQARSNYPSRTEKTLCWLTLGCLAAISAGIGLRQASFNPAVLAVRSLGQPQKIPPSQSALPLPPALKAFGPLEQFSPDNLYDKIDGKAELYLAAGFVQLRCQRFALQAAPDEWLEWFVYDMGTLPQAFSVFSTQRRSEGEPLELGSYAYRTRNGLYFVSGSNYVEAVASMTSDRLFDAMLGLWERFTATAPKAKGRLQQLEMFPPENLIPASYALQSADAFGFDQLKNVFTAQYKIDNRELTAFVTSCSNQVDAQALHGAYSAFLLANGGKEAATQLASCVRVDIMGGTELIFTEGSFVAGIHAASAAGPAEELARRLRQRLAGEQKAPQTR